jgi:hypothetical protein
MSFGSPFPDLASRPPASKTACSVTLVMRTTIAPLSLMPQPERTSATPVWSDVSTPSPARYPRRAHRRPRLLLDLDAPARHLAWMLDQAA